MDSASQHTRASRGSGLSRPARLSCILLAGALATGCGPDTEGPTPGIAHAAESGDAEETRFQQEAHSDAPRVTAATGSVDSSRRTAIVRAASRVAPAVVTVNVIRTERARPRTFFDSFFSRGPRRAAGFGSGVIIDSGGIILTNEHVVRNAERIMVTLSDGRDFEAELVGVDEVVDVAVLRVEGEALPQAPLGTSDGLIIGEWVVAIGNPFGTAVSNTEPTVTAGVVSAVERHIVPDSENEGFYLGMIQTDASINPGNSGGALVNALGQVVGLNASIFSRSGGSEGLGFAIPIDRALKVADDLLTHGEIRRAWLGFDVEPVEADVWGRTRGVRVARVAPGSPADEAGIEPGVRLMTADGRRLTAPLDFENVLLDLRAGERITLEMEGGDAPLVLRAESLPSTRAERVTALQDLDVITVTPEIRAERDVRSEAGALIVSVSPELQRQIGLVPGDVIVRINHTAIESAQDLADYFVDLEGQGRLRIVYERNGGYVSRDLYWNG